MAAIAASSIVLASTLGHRFYGQARIAALTYFQLAREAIAELRKSRARRHGPCLRVRNLDDAASPARTGRYGDGRGHLSRPGIGFRTDLLGGSRVRVYHDFGDLSQSGTLGDPSLATPEAGARFYNVVVDELVRFLEDFAHWKITARPGETER